MTLAGKKIKDVKQFWESIKSDTDLKEIINNIEPGYHPLMAAVNRKNYDHAIFLLENRRMFDTAA